MMYMGNYIKQIKNYGVVFFFFSPLTSWKEYFLLYFSALSRVNGAMTLSLCLTLVSLGSAVFS